MTITPKNRDFYAKRAKAIIARVYAKSLVDLPLPFPVRSRLQHVVDTTPGGAVWTKAQETH